MTVTADDGNAWWALHGGARHGVALLLVVAAVGHAAEPGGTPALAPTARDRMCVTNGVVTQRPGGRLAIDTASSRAVVRDARGDDAEIRFRYLGPSAQNKPLASGELRRQIGLKLRAHDTCNLLYVMWHIEPDDKLGVSIKRNPGQHMHAECHANGYTTIRPRTSVVLPQVRVGETHALRARLNGEELAVFADGRPVWTGSVGDGVFGIDGPVGLRTDNARFELEYLSVRAAGPDSRAVGRSVYHCEVGPGD
jgi:hypothetical protein